MANEPNNAEEQLKQYAEARRQQVPPEIHPATRNLLQGEVRRTYVSPEVEQRARLGIRWLRALAWVAILAVIPLFLLPRNPATKGPAEEATPSRPNEVNLPSASAPSGEAPIILSDTPTPVAAPTGAAPLPQPVRDEAPSAVRSRAVILHKEKDAEKKLEAAQALSAVANNRMSFANTLANPQALNRFQLEQAGATLNIIDADGSVYPGRVLNQVAGNDQFRVTGTNRTLNQRLVLTGQVLRATSNVRQQQTTANKLQNNNIDVSNNSNSNFLNYDDVRVQGQGTVGNNQIKVDAQLTPGP